MLWMVFSQDDVMTSKRISFRATARLLLAGRFTVVCYVLQCSRWGHEAMPTAYQPQLTQHARNGSKRVCGQRIQTVLDIRSFSARSCIRVRWHFSLNRTLVHSLSTWQCNSICPSRPALTFWWSGAEQKMEALIHHKIQDNIEKLIIINELSYVAAHTS